MQTNQTTRDIIAQMLKDQQTKANAQKAIFKSKQPKPQAKEEPQEEAKPVFETIEVKGYTVDEVENVDLSEILTDKPAPATTIKFDLPKAEQPTAPRIEMVKYTDLSFLLKGEDTYLIREELKALGGIYRHKWNGYGPAWMFSEKRREEIETFLSEFM